LRGRLGRATSPNPRCRIRSRSSKRKWVRKLLNRAARRVSLTVAGEVMLEEARRILATVDRARERMQDVTSGAVGRIRLGASATPGLYLLPSLLAKYRSAHPSFDLQFQIGAVNDIADRVIRNDLDMAVIAGRPPSTELRVKPLCRDELVAVRAPGTPANGKEPLRRADLERHCWILREEGSATRREVDGWIHRHRLTPARTMTFDGPDASNAPSWLTSGSPSCRSGRLTTSSKRGG
jgi:DNA-binding transcriptional LysR family regulator